MRVSTSRARNMSLGFVFSFTVPDLKIAFSFRTVELNNSMLRQASSLAES
jgi:hypothetical protein